MVLQAPNGTGRSFWHSKSDGKSQSPENAHDFKDLKK
jgi:hypothetical protein